MLNVEQLNALVNVTGANRQGQLLNAVAGDFVYLTVTTGDLDLQNNDLISRRIDISRVFRAGANNEMEIMDWERVTWLKIREAAQQGGALYNVGIGINGTVELDAGDAIPESNDRTVTLGIPITFYPEYI